MRFLIDENIRLEVVDFLNGEEYDIRRVPSGMKNSDVIHLAIKERRILLTHDIHFSNILLYPPMKHFGVIRIKIHPPSINAILTALRFLLKKTPPEGFNKKLIVLEKNGFRIRG